MGIPVASGATYCVGTSRWIQRQSQLIRVPLSIILTLVDSIVGFSKGISLKFRSITWLSQAEDASYASWHLRNGCRRISRAVEQVLGRIDAATSLMESRHAAYQRVLHSRFRENPLTGRMLVDEVTQPFLLRSIHPIGEELPREVSETLMTTRTFARTRGRDRYVPIQLLFEANHASTREEKILAVSKILAHSRFSHPENLERSREITFDGIHIPSLEIDRNRSIDPSHPLFMLLEERISDEKLASFTETLIQHAEASIVQGIKHEVSIDVARSHGDERVHAIGETQYSALSERSLEVQVDEMWDRVYMAVTERMPEAPHLEIVREAVFLMDHLSQTGYALSDLPLYLGVFNIGAACLFHNNEKRVEGNGLAEFLNIGPLDARLSKIDSKHEIHLSSDAKTLTARSLYILGIAPLENNRAIEACRLSATTTIDLLSRKATIDWQIEAGEE